MVKAEHEARMSPAGQDIYRKHNHEKGYQEATLAIQKQVVVRFCSPQDQQRGLDLLINAPHALGLEGAQISHYIKGSFAAFPASFSKTSDQLIQVNGRSIPSDCKVASVLQEQTTTSLHKIVTSFSQGYTVVLAGSAT